MTAGLGGQHKTKYHGGCVLRGSELPVPPLYWWTLSPNVWQETLHEIIELPKLQYFKGTKRQQSSHMGQNIQN